MRQEFYILLFEMDIQCELEFCFICPGESCCRSRKESLLCVYLLTFGRPITLVEFNVNVSTGDGTSSDTQRLVGDEAGTVIGFGTAKDNAGFEKLYTEYYSRRALGK
jgi:hypothetical protein